MTQWFTHTSIFLLLGGLLLAGCSATPPRYPEDHARYERIVEAVETLRIAYVEKDLSAAKDLMLPLEELQQLEGEIVQDFRVFTTMTLDLSIERIDIQENLITVYIQWQGVWFKSSQAGPVTARGHGILEWSGHQVILLAGVGGDLPFGMTIRQSLS